MRLTSPMVGAAMLLVLGAALMLVPLFEQAPGRVRVSAGPYPVQYLTAAIAGDAADVVALTDSSDTLLYVGGADPELDGLAAEADRARDVAAEIEPRGSTNAPWLYVPNMEVMARAVVAELTELDPGGAAVFQANAEAVLREVARLANDFATGTEECDHVELASNQSGLEHLAAGYGFRLVEGEGPALDLLLRPPPDGSNYEAGMTRNLEALMVSQQCRWPVVLGPAPPATP